jgi:hypothetical protein
MQYPFAVIIERESENLFDTFSHKVYNPRQVTDRPVT